MVRRLPWKDGTATKTLRVKGKSKDNTEHELSDATPPGPQDLEDKDDTHKEASDSSDDENYRITESEFVDTARYFTRDLHQQAYERLLQQQQKETETKNTISDLLAQPILPSEVVSVPPPPITVSKAKSTDLLSGIKNNLPVESSGLPYPPSTASSKAPRSEQQNDLSSEVMAKTIPKDTIKSRSESKQTIVPKLSDAAAARRRKRQEAQKADIAVDSFV